MKHAIITGATGFVGSNLCRYLLKKQWKISIISRPTSNYNNLKDLTEQLNIFEYSGELEALVAFFKSTPVDVVYHLASQVVVDHQSDQIDHLVDSNITFGLHILEAMKESGHKLLINTGTYWQHYNSEGYNPVNLYAATKEAYEALIKYYVASEGVRAVTLKLFDTYGEMDQRPKLINLLHTFSDNKEVLKVSPGNQKIDLVHIDDVVKAYESAYNHLVNGSFDYETFGVSSGHPIPLRELISTFERVTQKKINVVWGGRPYRKREVMNPWQSYKTLPNWKAEISLEEGLLRYK
jgi:nucleoside-diphosphate-sugar epimerase